MEEETKRKRRWRENCIERETCICESEYDYVPHSTFNCLVFTERSSKAKNIFLLKSYLLRSYTIRYSPRDLFYSRLQFNSRF